MTRVLVGMLPTLRVARVFLMTERRSPIPTAEYIAGTGTVKVTEGDASDSVRFRRP